MRRYSGGQSFPRLCSEMKDVPVPPRTAQRQTSDGQGKYVYSSAVFQGRCLSAQRVACDMCATGWI